MIAGCMRLYPGSELTVSYALPALLRLCDRLYLLLHNTEPPNGLPDNTRLQRWQGRWDHGRQLEAVFRMTDQDEPKWVLYPDSDEILPEWEFPAILQAADQDKKDAISFPFAVPWNGFSQQVKQDRVPTGPHVKAARWSRDLHFEDRGGFCVPIGYWKRIHACNTPLLHLYALNEPIRKLRLDQGRSDVHWFERGGFKLEPAPTEWKRYEGGAT